VGNGERQVSLIAGVAAAAIGLARRDLPGLLLSAIGAGMVYRGATGHCGVYQAIGLDTAEGSEESRPGWSGLSIAKSFLIDRSPEDLYCFWRDFENLPVIMSHLKSVEVLDDRRSRWTVDAPLIAGGSLTWDAEILEDLPNKKISWASLPGGDVANDGSVEFQKAPGSRGTAVRVAMRYAPPAGSMGKWIGRMLGSNPESQIHEDLRNFKRAMELGEIITTDGQPRGACTAGLGRLLW
jgi:uncharacterized membrane protein